MTREEFVSLPPRIALGLIYDRAQTWLEGIPRPDVPKPPLYDGRLSKGDKGFVWMSEMTLRDLEWWRDAKQKSAANNAENPDRAKWAEKDAKTAATLQKWIAWRFLFPTEAWSGKRGEERVTAALPSRDARTHQWGPRNDTKKPAIGGRSNTPEPPPEEGGDGEGYGF